MYPVYVFSIFRLVRGLPLSYTQINMKFLNKVFEKSITEKIKQLLHFNKIKSQNCYGCIIFITLFKMA